MILLLRQMMPEYLGGGESLSCRDRGDRHMKKADVIGNPVLLKIWVDKQARRKTRRDTQKNTPGGKEGASVKQVFEGVLAGMKKEAETRITAHYTKIAEETKEFDKLEVMKGYHAILKKFGRNLGGGYYGNSADSAFSQRLLKYTFSFPQRMELIPEAEIRTYIAKTTARDVQQMFESFILKQTEKVNGILKGRKVKVHSQVYPNLEGTFAFTLEDGSKFLMKTQVVWKISPKGKRFWQFPTTFHNAIKADGVRIRTPSEAVLKKEL